MKNVLKFKLVTPPVNEPTTYKKLTGPERVRHRRLLLANMWHVIDNEGKFESIEDLQHRLHVIPYLIENFREKSIARYNKSIKDNNTSASAIKLATSTELMADINYYKSIGI